MLTLAACGYLLAFAVWLPALRRAAPERISRVRPALAFVLFALAFVFHTAGMILTGLRLGRCPVGSPAELLQFVAWSIVLTYGMVATLFRTSLPAFFTSALAAVLCAAALNMDTVAFNAGEPPVVMAHAGLSLFAYGAFGLFALTSAMYLIQLFGIRHRRWANIFALLPSLRELESVNLRLLVVGLAVYTAAISIGAWSIHIGQGSVGASKLVFALLVLAGYSGALALRLAGRLYGRRLALAGLCLFALALFTLYPVGSQSRAAGGPEPHAQEAGR